jgi:putative transposase
VITLVLHVLRLLPFLVGGQRQLALENLALRQQLAVYKRIAPRPRLYTMDRLFWAGLARVWTGWREALVIVSPDTVLRWQRRRFRDYWTRLSGRSRGGRPHVDTEVTALIGTMATGRILCGARLASTASS